MATKDYCLPNIAAGEFPKCQYSNLNLNQMHRCLDVSYCITNDSRKAKISDFDEPRTKKNSWNKSSKDLISRLLNIYSDSEEKDEFPKTKSINRSTLSLHIPAYENVADDASSIECLTYKRKKSGLAKKLDTATQIFTGASSIIHNLFEFPRQQKDEAKEPEIMQFKTSQQLLDQNTKISRIDHSKFYNSLTSEQKLFFTKYEEERQALETDFLKTKILLHEEKTETKKFKDDAKIPFGTILSNEIYYDLLKLTPQPYQRRKKILEFFGLSNREKDLTVLPTKYLYKFEEKFQQSRKTAAKKGQLSDFNKEIVIFPNDKLPLVTEENLFGKNSSTLMEETVINDSEMSSENDAGDMPVLDAMEVTEPTIKKIRLESYPQNFEIISSSECQTDLQLNHILQLEEVKKKFKNLKDKIHYHKKKSQALKERNNDYENLVAELEEDSNLLDEEVHQLQIFREENEKLKQEVQERDKIILELNDLLGNHKKNNKFLLKNKNSKFTVEAHTCFSRLLSQGNVAQDKVSIVIRVVADLFKISIDAVPSRWTVGRDIHTIQSLNCEYIDKFINECSNLSFLSDETTKFTKKLQAFVLTGKNDKSNQKFVLFLGVGEVPSKSAERCLQEFKQMLSNISKINGLNVEQFINDTVINIRNLMGDQAATTKLLYTLFIEYRSFCLESSDFDDTTKASLQRVNTLFCMLHILSNSSAIVFKALLEHEKFCTNNEEITEATVLWVLNEVPRYFAKRSSGRYSTAGQWEALAKEMELMFFKIDSNAGHRFIIRFIIASEITYNREEIIAFLENLGNTDSTLVNLKNALKNELIILHLHILSLLGALILQPMWQLSEASESVLQMSLYAPALINYLKDLVDDPMLLFTVNSPFDAFPAATQKENSKSSAFLKSLKERQIPVGASEVVPIVAKGLLEYFEKQLDPFINGIYASPDIALERETAGAPLTNMPCESAFGYIDRMFTIKPNMTTYNRSALMVAAKNNVFGYIATLPEEEQREMYLRAFNNKHISAELAAKKSQQIHRENIEKIEQQALKQQLDKKKSEAKRKKIAVELRECGFWLTLQEMDTALINIPPTTAIKYIKSNIRFRKTVWSPKFEPKNLLQFSHQKHTYTYSELLANLKAVIVADCSGSDSDTNYTSDSDED